MRLLIILLLCLGIMGCYSTPPAIGNALKVQLKYTKAYQEKYPATDDEYKLIGQELILNLETLIKWAEVGK